MTPVIVWFRQDLRLADNPALRFAAQTGLPLICLYILDDETPGPWRPGGAARWWLHQSLHALDAALEKRGGGLVLRRGRADQVLRQVIGESGAQTLVWNRCYEPYAVARDSALKQSLAANGVAVESFNAALLFEPWEIATKEGKPFRVFTPFWSALRARTAPARPQPAPRGLHFHRLHTERLQDWKLPPDKPDWAQHFDWIPGEAAARRALDHFLEGVAGYKRERDLPARPGTARLSPHLHWGEIGPRQVWHAVRARAGGEGAETFLKELGWREFCYQLLFHHPDLPAEPLDRRFARFGWWGNADDFRAWTGGRTGIPIVDAGMRQLWRTGWMHNRVRMIAASFLIKHLGVDWRRGQAWFWDTLVDADLANNAANWQWVAGSGADAAPFFRIFNPVLQGEKFDPQGRYVRAFLPELADVPDKFVHRPWAAPHPPAGYPAPIVDLAAGRAQALKQFHRLSAHPSS